MKVGETVFPNIGPFEGHPVKIITVEYDTGARNGWFTCETQNGERLLYAGEELRCK